MTRPIRNTGPCFLSGLPGPRDVLSHTDFYAPIFCMLSVFQAIPFELLRKPPTVNRWDSTLGTPHQYRPQCEVCPIDHGKVVESLQGQPFCSVEYNHLCNVCRGYPEEQFCGMILNLGQWFSCHLKDFLS